MSEIKDQEVGFMFCKFEGPPPVGFDSWVDWAKEPIKRNVIIKAWGISEELANEN